ncbi:MAG TPA: hypothetical protein VHX92_04750 [Rhizomicrobium sp.]|jgi:hypothetical protein|nr:hypothetical protein [Rhizomicrobium sp.]
MTDGDRDRSTFLVAMYNQLMNDINRHIVVVWQSVGVLFAAFASLSLVEKQIIPIDVGITLIIIVCAWVIAHVYDASYWYNRNLVIIANIERQFLRQSDLHDIHYYFGTHRPASSMITHLRIQLWLAVSTGGLVLLYHFISVVLPTLSPSAPIRWLSTFPYFGAAIVAGVWVYSWWRSVVRYETFLKNSPGKEIDTSGIQHGPGHPT